MNYEEEESWPSVIAKGMCLIAAGVLIFVTMWAFV